MRDMKTLGRGPSILKGQRERLGERVKRAKAGSLQLQATGTYTARPRGRDDHREDAGMGPTSQEVII